MMMMAKPPDVERPVVVVVVSFHPSGTIKSLHLALSNLDPTRLDRAPQLLSGVDLLSMARPVLPLILCPPLPASLRLISPAFVVGPSFRVCPIGSLRILPGAGLAFVEMTVRHLRVFVEIIVLEISTAFETPLLLFLHRDLLDGTMPFLGRDVNPF
jgi:hypothetical protein